MTNPWSGGPAKIKGPNGVVWNKDYAPNFTQRSIAGGGYSHNKPLIGEGMPSYGSVWCGVSPASSDPVTFTFNWDDEDIIGNDAPAYVVLKIDSTAQWMGDSGSASNGLGHIAVYDQPSGHYISTGSKYELIANPGDSFEYQISPSAHAQVASASQHFSAHATVSVTVTVYPIRIQLLGVLEASDEDPSRILIGQNLGAVVDKEGLPSGTGETFNWTVSGCNPFQSWNINTVNDSSHVTNFVPQTASALSSFLRTPGTATVSVSYYWPFMNATLNLSETVEVLAPSTQWGVYVQLPEFVPSAASPASLEHESQSTGQPGMLLRVWCTTPAGFVNGHPGYVNMVQLVTPNRSKDNLVPYDTRFADWAVNGVQGLDKSFPYHTFWSGAVYSLSNSDDGNADGTEWITMDSAGQHVGTDSVYAFDSFESTILYEPPKVNGRLDSQYVPIKQYDWYWKGLGTFGVPAWSLSPRESAWSAQGDFPPHPTWSYRVDSEFWTYL